MEASKRFAPDVRNVSAARRFVRDVLSECSDAPAQLSDIVTLLVSEVVTNAIVHGDGPVDLTIRGRDDTIWIGVRDHDRAAVTRVPRRTIDEHGINEHGFGLWILSELADEWGVATDGPQPGKTVWFSVPLVAKPHDGRPGRADVEAAHGQLSSRSP